MKYPRMIERIRSATSSRPNEVALKVGKADLAFVSVLDQSDHFALVRNAPWLNDHTGATDGTGAQAEPSNLLQSISNSVVFAANDFATYCNLHQ